MANDGRQFKVYKESKGWSGSEDDNVVNDGSEPISSKITPKLAANFEARTPLANKVLESLANVIRFVFCTLE